jgi:glycosyltransferase involved in cell wall biosynthesis
MAESEKPANSLKKTRVLMIGTVWPEPTSSAAGLRDWNLIQAFQDQGWEIIFTSPAKPNEFQAKLESKNIQTLSLGPNDSRFDSFIENLRPDFVIFDRFMIEEQFSWRVKKYSPSSIRVLDTIDVHFLRRGRSNALQNGIALEKVFSADFDLLSEDCLRELASIFRSDLTLVLSDFEMQMLQNRFQVPKELLRISRFMYGSSPKALPEYHSREHFVVIGNFRHPPNPDGILWLHHKIWPLIREKLPQAQVHIYGAYPPKEMMALSDPDQGFHVMGHAADQHATLSRYRVSLAPLRFGAGIKGKISDSWWVGTPVVTTPIGAEGMTDQQKSNWGGQIATHAEEFARMAVELYASKLHWSRAQESAFRITQSLFDYRKNSLQLVNDLSDVKERSEQIRRQNLVGMILWHNAFKSTKYFSKWIELKNNLKTSNPLHQSQNT